MSISFLAEVLQENVSGLPVNYWRMINSKSTNLSNLSLIFSCLAVFVSSCINHDCFRKTFFIKHFVVVVLAFSFLLGKFSRLLASLKSFFKTEYC